MDPLCWSLPWPGTARSVPSVLGTGSDRACLCSPALRVATEPGNNNPLRVNQTFFLINSFLRRLEIEFIPPA